jgi:thiosulfate dehydrogenase [quinone] large subunit
MENFLATKTQRVPLVWISLLRILLGILFLTTWSSNLTKSFYTPDGLVDFFTNVFPQSENPLAWYAAFINGIILPIRGFFAPFQLVAEFLIGVFLLLGFLTPLTSFAGIIFIINTFLASFGHDWPWSYGMMLAILAVVLVTRAGRSIGIDNLLYDRRGEPRIPFLW